MQCTEETKQKIRQKAIERYANPEKYKQLIPYGEQDWTNLKTSIVNGGE
jgi:hypothetical protein